MPGRSSPGPVTAMAVFPCTRHSPGAGAPAPLPGEATPSATRRQATPGDPGPGPCNTPRIASSSSTLSELTVPQGGADGLLDQISRHPAHRSLRAETCTDQGIQRLEQVIVRVHHGGGLPVGRDGPDARRLRPTRPRRRRRESACSSRRIVSSLSGRPGGSSFIACTSMMMVISSMRRRAGSSLPPRAATPAIKCRTRKASPDLRLPGAQSLAQGGACPPVLADPAQKRVRHRPQDPPVFLG